jgi:hypothetical protein
LDAVGHWKTLLACAFSLLPQQIPYLERDFVPLATIVQRAFAHQVRLGLYLLQLKNGRSIAPSRNPKFDQSPKCGGQSNCVAVSTGRFATPDMDALIARGDSDSVR